MTSTELTERVAPHPRLSGSEKETAITMYGDGKEFTIFSAKRTIVRSLLEHDHFETKWASVADGDDVVRIEGQEAVEESEGDIVAIEGTLPVGTLTVKSKPRANNHQSSIVSTETIDSSVFGDDS